jgi:hypothetical protein
VVRQRDGVKRVAPSPIAESVEPELPRCDLARDRARARESACLDSTDQELETQLACQRPCALEVAVRFGAAQTMVHVADEKLERAREAALRSKLREEVQKRGGVRAAGAAHQDTPRAEEEAARAQVGPKALEPGVHGSPAPGGSLPRCPGPPGARR